MANTLIFGGGGIAEGIAGFVPGCTIVIRDECDATTLNVQTVIADHSPEVVIVCCGVSHPRAIKDLDLQLVVDEIGANLLAPFVIAKFAAQNGVRTMIFIASVAGLYGKPGHAAYSASKSGVISLVESLSMEGYDAYAISPGRVDTPMRERDYPDDKPGTRLEPCEIGWVVEDIIAGKYRSGDNIIIRRIGFETVPILVDRNDRWREELRVGQPKTL